MNEETQDLLRRLELATSTTPVDRSELDQETAEMRESWLLLGRMLKGAESAEWSAVSSQSNQQLWKVPVRHRRSRGWWLLGGLVSAIAATSIWWLVAGGSVDEGAASGGTPVAQKPTAFPVTPAPAQRSPVTSNQGESTVAPDTTDSTWTSALAWEDGWEDGLSRTAQVVEQFHGRPPADAPLQWLESEFQELAREFESSSL